MPGRFTGQHSGEVRAPNRRPVSLTGRYLTAAIVGILALWQADTLQAQQLTGIRGSKSLPLSGETALQIPNLADRSSALTQTKSTQLSEEENAEMTIDGGTATSLQSQSTPAPVTVGRVKNRKDDAADSSQPPAGTASADTISDDVQSGIDIRPTGAVKAEKPENERIESIDSAAREPEDNPYGPTGLRIGNFIVKPSIEQGIEWSSNAESSPDGSEAVLSQTTLRLTSESDWSRHRAYMNFYGRYSKTLTGEDYVDPQAVINAGLQFDLSGSWRLLSEGRYILRRESAASSVSFIDTQTRPLRQDIVASTALENTAGKMRFKLMAAVDRTVYGDATLTDGDTVSQEERNSTLATLAFRGGYEISPAVVPFLEIAAGRRFYDRTLDSSGFARSANHLDLRAGISLDLQEKLVGELSVGWVGEQYDDHRLAPISQPAFTARLNWSPSRLTDVTLLGTTSLEGSTSEFDSGSTLYDSAILIEHSLLANLTSNLLFSASWRDFSYSSDHDLTLRAQLAMTYWFNRHVGVTGRISHETVTSTDPDRESQTNSAYLGLRWQH